jgi:hypothetical protein
MVMSCCNGLSVESIYAPLNVLSFALLDAFLLKPLHYLIKKFISLVTRGVRKCRGILDINR